jgi:1-acyl-sn-glycerol-3-phosphate acyltransferase
MRLVVAAWRLLRAASHMLHGVLVIAVRFRALDNGERMQRVQWWSAKFLHVLGVSLVVGGAPRPGAKLLVANHVSWLDILAINAAVPACFVSKSEIRRWPVVGWLATSAGTLYIERAQRRDAMRVVHRIAEAFQAGDTLAVFPEGTTTDGRELLPFHANLLQGAIATHTPVQPLALRYSDDVHRISPSAAYAGDTTLWRSIAMIVWARGLTAHVDLLEAHGNPHGERRALARQLRCAIAARLGIDTAD